MQNPFNVGLAQQQAITRHFHTLTYVPLGLAAVWCGLHNWHLRLALTNYAEFDPTLKVAVPLGQTNAHKVVRLMEVLVMVNNIMAMQLLQNNDWDLVRAALAYFDNPW